MTAQRVFIVVAAYNERDVIQPVVAKLLVRYPHVVIVDDGSTDGTAQSVAGTGALVVRHVTNRGQGAALQTGVTFALTRGADIIVTFDSDGQHDERDIASVVEPILAGVCDVTLGSRFLGRAVDIPIARRLVLKTAVLFTRVFTRIRVTDAHNGLRAFSRRAAESLNISMDGMGHASEILDLIKAAGWRYREVPVTITYSRYSLEHGQSSWNALTIAAQLLLKRISR